MSLESDAPRSLRDLEQAVEAEGREWMRRLELSRRLQWEAQRSGLGRARDVLAVADGAPWIWNKVGDRWPQAHQLLDFYHASQHLWNVG